MQIKLKSGKPTIAGISGRQFIFSSLSLLGPRNLPSRVANNKITRSERKERI